MSFQSYRKTYLAPFHISLASFEFSLKSKTASLSCFLIGALEPLTHNIADFNISKERRVLIQDTITPYSSFCFSASFWAKLVKNIDHSWLSQKNVDFLQCNVDFLQSTCIFLQSSCNLSMYFCSCEFREHKNEYEFRKTFNDVKMVMMIHSETGTKALCVNMFLLLFLRDLGYVTNAIQLQRLNK